MNYITRTKTIVTYVGESFDIKLPMNIGTCLENKSFDYQDGDRIEFVVVRPNDSSNNPILLKELNINDIDEDNNLNIHFDMEDTYYLDPIVYSYFVRVYYTRDDIEQMKIIIPRKTFSLLK